MATIINQLAFNTCFCTDKRFKMNKIEVNGIDHDIDHLDCPFCEKKVMQVAEDGEAIINSCTHLLFIATDYGFEYNSERFNLHMNVPERDPDYCGEFSCIDEFTSQVTLKGAIKYAAYTPTPGCLGVYYGFAP